MILGGTNWSPVGEIPVQFTLSASNSGPRALRQQSQCHSPCQAGHHCCRKRTLSVLQDTAGQAAVHTVAGSQKSLFTEETAGYKASVLLRAHCNQGGGRLG